jgi:hypothetical protein
MTKNFTIVALAIIAALLALRPDPQDLCKDDPNIVVIEYECNSLTDYDNVPLEVIAECRSRAGIATKHNHVINQVDI